MTTITLEKAYEAMKEAVAEKGEGYVYERIDGNECTYAEPDEHGNFQPSCIVGHVIYKLDPGLFKKVADLEWKVDEDTEEFYVATPESVDVIARKFYEHFDGATASLRVQDVPVVRALLKAQNAQDSSLPWGDALAEFEEAA